MMRVWCQNSDRNPDRHNTEDQTVTQEQAWSIACDAYDAAEEAADEQYAVSIFCAQSNRAIADAEAEFTLAMRNAREALNVARFEWQA